MRLKKAVKESLLSTGERGRGPFFAGVDPPYCKIHHGTNPVFFFYMADTEFYHIIISLINTFQQFVESGYIYMTHVM